MEEERYEVEKETEPLNAEANPNAEADPNTETESKEKADDKASVGVCILSLIMPLIGIILFFVNIKSRPKRAKAIGICSLIGIAIGVVIRIIL